MDHATDGLGSMNDFTVAPQQILPAGANEIYEFPFFFFFLNDSFDQRRCCFKVPKVF